MERVEAAAGPKAESSCTRNRGSNCHRLGKEAGMSQMDASAGLAGQMEAGREVSAVAAAGLTRNEADRKRVEAVVESLAELRNGGESLSEIAHDVRNMVTALGLYCDLLEEPGVLNPPYQHYGSELRLVATASRRLVEKLMALDGQQAEALAQAQNQPAGDSESTLMQHLRTSESSRRWELIPAELIDNLASELLANRNLLSALAGPAIAVTVDAESGARAVRLSGEDLTRILVNLVKNASEAMPKGGRIQIGLRERDDNFLELTVADNGPGIAKKSIEKIFESGYSTHSKTPAGRGSWAAAHRGLGLSITRSILEASGGHITATNRPQGGALFTLELPVRSR